MLIVLFQADLSSSRSEVEKLQVQLSSKSKIEEDIRSKDQKIQDLTETIAKLEVNIFVDAVLVSDWWVQWLGWIFVCVYYVYYSSSLFNDEYCWPHFYIYFWVWENILFCDLLNL